MSQRMNTPRNFKIQDFSGPGLCDFFLILRIYCTVKNINNFATMNILNK